ncbi:MAG: aspartate dehydrogenase [Faecousia sp.]
MLFGRRKQSPVPYDKTGKIPVIRSSICTGEQVAGFKETASGKFQEIMLIRNGEDLREFLEKYQVTESEIRREW